jgi:hypothetical protein
MTYSKVSKSSAVTASNIGRGVGVYPMLSGDGAALPTVPRSRHARRPLSRGRRSLEMKKTLRREEPCSKRRLRWGWTRSRVHSRAGATCWTPGSLGSLSSANTDGRLMAKGVRPSWPTCTPCYNIGPWLVNLIREPGCFRRHRSRDSRTSKDIIMRRTQPLSERVREVIECLVRPQRSLPVFSLCNGYGVGNLLQLLPVRLQRPTSAD